MRAARDTSIATCFARRRRGRRRSRGRKIDHAARACAPEPTRSFSPARASCCPIASRAAQTLVIEDDRIVDVVTGPRRVGAGESHVRPRRPRHRARASSTCTCTASTGVDVLDGAGARSRASPRRLPRCGVTAFCPTSIACPPGVLERVSRRASRRCARRRPPAPRACCRRISRATSSIPSTTARSRRGVPAAVAARGDRVAGRRERRRSPARDILDGHRSPPRPTSASSRWRPSSTAASISCARSSRPGVRVSLGHSGATFEEAQAAIAAGARHATHLFNRMRPMTHREPGLAGAVLGQRRSRRRAHLRRPSRASGGRCAWRSRAKGAVAGHGDHRRHRRIRPAAPAARAHARRPADHRRRRRAARRRHHGRQRGDDGSGVRAGWSARAASICVEAAHDVRHDAGARAGPASATASSRRGRGRSRRPRRPARGRRRPGLAGRRPGSGTSARPLEPSQPWIRDRHSPAQTHDSASRPPLPGRSRRARPAWSASTTRATSSARRSASRSTSVADAAPLHASTAPSKCARGTGPRCSSRSRSAARTRTRSRRSRFSPSRRATASRSRRGTRAAAGVRRHRRRITSPSAQLIANVPRNTQSRRPHRRRRRSSSSASTGRIEMRTERRLDPRRRDRRRAARRDAATAAFSSTT